MIWLDQIKKRKKERPRREKKCAWSDDLIGKICEEVFEKKPWILHLKSSSQNWGAFSGNG